MSKIFLLFIYTRTLAKLESVFFYYTCLQQILCVSTFPTRLFSNYFLSNINVLFLILNKGITSFPRFPMAAIISSLRYNFMTNDSLKILPSLYISSMKRLTNISITPSYHLPRIQCHRRELLLHNKLTFMSYFTLKIHFFLLFSQEDIILYSKVSLDILLDFLMSFRKYRN